MMVQASKQLSVIDSNVQGVKVEYSTYMFVAQVVMVFLVFLCGIIHLFLPDSIRNQQFDGMWLSLVSACAGVRLPSPQLRHLRLHELINHCIYYVMCYV